METFVFWRLMSDFIIDYMCMLIADTLPLSFLHAIRFQFIVWK